MNYFFSCKFEKTIDYTWRC